MTYTFELEHVLLDARKLGDHTTSFGAHLYGHVPHVAPAAWLHATYKGLSQEEISALENRLCRALPPEFSRFLSWSNGLNLFSGSLAIYGVRSSYERAGDAAWQPFAIEPPNLQERPRGAKSSHLFVGGYFDDGSRLVIDCETSKVFRLPQGKAGPVLTDWPNFEDMIETETHRLSLLFDCTGRLLEKDGSTVPN